MTRAEYHQDLALDKVETFCADLCTMFPNLGKRYIAGTGPYNPRIMLVGDTPNAATEVSGKPFAGKDGFILRQLMEMAEIGPPHVWMTYLVKYRTRTWSPPLVNGFRKALMQEWIAVGRPKHIITIGSQALNAVTDKEYAMVVAAGKAIGGREVTIHAMLHPGFGLANGERAQEITETHWIKLGERLATPD